jgi:hypothetical protein
VVDTRPIEWGHKCGHRPATPLIESLCVQATRHSALIACMTMTIGTSCTRRSPDPVTIAGDITWQNYTVSARCHIGSVSPLPVGESKRLLVESPWSSLSANASGVDTHRDSISSRFECRPAAAAGGPAAAAAAPHAGALQRVAGAVRPEGGQPTLRAEAWGLPGCVVRGDDGKWR